MSDLSLVTSGDYQRYYVVDGVRYHHLIDPATLWPAAYFDGVSVLAPDSGVADCLTTGLFCLPLEEGKQLVESLDGVEALWCTTDGEVIIASQCHLSRRARLCCLYPRPAISSPFGGAGKANRL